MLKYSEFLLEKMINESIVVFSDKFKKLLSDIDSPIAKQILDLEQQDLNVQSNYIDISKDKDYITFIPDRKAQEIVTKADKEKYAKYTGSQGTGVLKHRPANQNMFNKLGYTFAEGVNPYYPNTNQVGEVIRKEKSDETDNTYVHLKFPEGECVINQNRLEYIDNSLDVWSKNRQPIAVGRGLRALLKVKGIEVTDADLAKFVNLYKSGWDKMHDKFSRFELVKGDLIPYWYNFTKYDERKGSLSNSCMANAPDAWLEIYKDNCELLILKNEKGDKIRGRALVWTLDRPKDQIFMDRIYTNDESDVELFKQYALEQGWYYKKYNGSSSDGTRVSKSGEDSSFMYVNINKLYNNYPYLDTLKYFNGDVLTNKYSSGFKTLEDTGGGGFDDCDYCGGETTRTCGECSGDGYSECSNCDGSGVDTCGCCDGDGKLECGNCDSSGHIECGNCDGSGEVDDETCPDCGGNGELECDDCGGQGKISCDECSRGEVDCETCSGSGQESCNYCGGEGYYGCPECS